MPHPVTRWLHRAARVFTFLVGTGGMGTPPRCPRPRPKLLQPRTRSRTTCVLLHTASKVLQTYAENVSVQTQMLAFLVTCHTLHVQHWTPVQHVSPYSSVISTPVPGGENVNNMVRKKFSPGEENEALVHLPFLHIYYTIKLLTSPHQNQQVR